MTRPAGWPALWWRVAVAAAAGGATAAGFAPTGWWPATVLGVAALTWSLKGTQSRRQASTCGAAFGLAVTSSTLNWMAMIDRWAAAGLILLVSGWFVLLALIVRVLTATRWWPLSCAGAWVLVEYLASRVPFGGFGWLRLGYAMVDSPLAGLLPLLGVGGLSLAAALTGNLLTWLATHPEPSRVVAATSGITVLLLAATAAGTIELPTTGEPLKLGWVQGGAPGGGVFGLGPAGSTTRRHATQTSALANRVAALEMPQPDIVVWPENSTDIDPAGDEPTRSLIATSSRNINAPILVGEILDGPGPGNRRTASQLWTSQGADDAIYVKRSIVPFGEWIPYRDLLLPLIPQLRYVGNQTVAGESPGVLPVKLNTGRTIQLGVLICFDVAFDPVAYDLPTSGAQVIVVQSSNAMYQGSAQVAQQFAITRTRAAELRREVVVATTSGISGVIDTTGKPLVTATAGAASGVQILPVRTGLTPAAMIGLPVQQLISLATALSVAAQSWINRRGRPDHVEQSRMQNEHRL